MWDGRKSSEFKPELDLEGCVRLGQVEWRGIRPFRLDMGNAGNSLRQSGFWKSFQELRPPQAVIFPSKYVKAG